MLTALEFFAGSGLVRLGLQPDFTTVWANDMCIKKRAVYSANFPAGNFHLADICDVRGATLPTADLAWASFPCQDLSLAGNLKGLEKGTRSGLFWEWLRVLREMEKHGKRVPVLAAENVVGFLAADGGVHFERAYRALREMRYRAGAIVVDARDFVPQSRPRAFLIAVSDEISIEGSAQPRASGHYHPESVLRAASQMDDPSWIWWSLPIAQNRVAKFADICERDAQCAESSSTMSLLDMLSPLNRKKLDAARKSNGFFAGTAYRRTRPDAEGNRVQRLEVRFDGIAGCLRTPNGGSSRQTVVLLDNGAVRSRLMTVRECARLMGAPDSFAIPGSYNDGYRAMGDAVVVPVTRWITKHLLAPLALSSQGTKALIFPQQPNNTEAIQANA